MPRPPKDYSTPQPYTPGAPPVAGSSTEQVIRATWDEFHRIAAYLADPGTVVVERLQLRRPDDADQPD